MMNLLLLIFVNSVFIIARLPMGILESKLSKSSYITKGRKEKRGKKIDNVQDATLVRDQCKKWKKYVYSVSWNYNCSFLFLIQSGL